MMAIRNATTSDLKALEELYKELLPQEDVYVSKEVIQKISTLPEYHLLVYEEGEVLATALLIICYDPVYKDKNFGVVENVIVRSDCRGKGIGEKLMNRAEEIGKENRCLYLMLLSGKSRLGAHKFYEKCGYDGNISLGFKKYI
ncbi:MAG: GNAT family N-acetyltransferase [Clostridia bacterium]|nr:GNAT family N-acetyltransferase [Clostridia bacterium]